MADYISTLDGPSIDAALEDMAQHESEAHAVGTRNGVEVSPSDPTYHNNSKYWATVAGDLVSESGITDPDNDGNLVVSLPSGESSAWAVRVDEAQTLSESEKSQAKANISAASSNPNLLDNPWFGSGEVVNQRGVSSGTLPATAYGIDRWQFSYGSAAGTYSLGSSGLSLTGSTGGAYIIQKLPMSLAGRTTTLSVMLSDGTVYSGSETFGASKTFYNSNGITLGTDANSSVFCKIASGQTTVIRAMKLEIGTVSTLAYDAPNYVSEFEKCKFYFRRIKSSVSFDPVGYGLQSSSTRCYIKIPGSMRTTPTPSFSGTLKLIGNTSASIDVTSITAGQTDSEGVTLLVNTAGSLTANHTYTMYLTSGSYIDLSADL